MSFGSESEIPMTEVLGLTAIAEASKTERAEVLAANVREAMTFLRRAEQSEARSVGTVVRNLVAVGTIVQAAIAAKLVTSPTHFAKVAAGFTTSAMWTEHRNAVRAVRGDVGVSIPRQRTFDRAHKLALSLSGPMSKGATLDDDESTSLVVSYLRMNPESPTVGAFTEWAMRGCDNAAPKAVTSAVKVTFAPAKLAAKLAAKLTPAQLRQLAAALVKLADAPVAQSAAA